MNDRRFGCIAVLCLAVTATLAAQNKSKDPAALPQNGDPVVLKIAPLAFQHETVHRKGVTMA